MKPKSRVIKPGTYWQTIGFVSVLAIACMQCFNYVEYLFYLVVIMRRDPFQIPILKAWKPRPMQPQATYG